MDFTTLESKEEINLLKSNSINSEVPEPSTGLTSTQGLVDEEEYEIDSELEEYLFINNKVEIIYNYIKSVSNPGPGQNENSIYPFFDKLTISGLMEFLYSDIEIDDKFLF